MTPQQQGGGVIVVYTVSTIGAFAVKSLIAGVVLLIVLVAFMFFLKWFTEEQMEGQVDVQCELKKSGGDGKDGNVKNPTQKNKKQAPPNEKKCNKADDTFVAMST